MRGLDHLGHPTIEGQAVHHQKVGLSDALEVLRPGVVVLDIYPGWNDWLDGGESVTAHLLNQIAEHAGAGRNSRPGVRHGWLRKCAR
jgi:hypothetical protein